MKKVLTLTAVISMLVAAPMTFGQGQGQDQGDDQDAPKFHHRNQRGEDVDVLPAPGLLRGAHEHQPVDAPPSDDTAVYAASYGSGNLIDHGGLEIANAAFQAIYYNASVAASTATSTVGGIHYPTIKDQIAAFTNAYSSSSNWAGRTTDDYAIIQQYGSHATIASSLFSYPGWADSVPSASSITDAAVQSYLNHLFVIGQFVPNAHTVYGVYFPDGQNVTFPDGSASCTDFCGYHSYFTQGTGASAIQIKYAVFPYLNCSACSLTGKSVADMLTIVTSHEIREAVSDPGDSGLDAWYDRRGYEADDKCAWHNLYQMSGGGFWVQPEYSNGGTVTRSGFQGTYPGPGCVVPNKVTGGGHGKGK